MKYVKKNISTICICSLLALCMVFPFKFYAVKIFLIVFIVLLMFKNCKKKIFKKQDSFWWGQVFIFSNLLFLVYGELKGNQAFHYYFKTEFL